MSQGSFGYRSKTARWHSFIRVSRTFSPLLLAAAFSAPATAQQPAYTHSQSSPYTLHGSARIVLTDVTVKDRAGHIIHSLPASIFHVSDNNQPQTISTFEEHNNATTAIAAQPISTPNTYSNEFLKHLPPVLNIVVLDTTSLSLTQQMYLAYEFNSFLKTLPPDLPLALYARVGEIPVLVQDFTSDHALLLAASAKVMPHLPPPGRDPVHITDNNLLQELGVELSQLPGHKNILWFSGGEAGISFDPRSYSDPTVLQSVYDQLELARISVYPIDARGLMVANPRFIALQHLEMREIADNTGGHDDPHEPVDVAQNVGLPRGDLYLFVAIWDLNTGRTGTLQIPFTAR